VTVITEDEARHWVLDAERTFIVLRCGDCGAYFLPAKLERYGDQACPSCGSLSTGFVTEETV
jgi:uncharacterized OB-fold protein